MYLSSIQLKNTGPLQDLDLTMPFNGENPKPLILVGRNGSGKSTVISYVVNALIALKQRVYEDVEVEQGKVYRLRSPLGIHGGATFFFAKVDFDLGVKVVEWQLDRKKSEVADKESMLAIDDSWNLIDPNETSLFHLHLGTLEDNHAAESLLAKTSHLFFPADRFELPDWLNADSLSSELRLPEASRIKGKTNRRIIARNRLKPTLEWLTSVLFDVLVENDTRRNAPSFADAFRRSIEPSKARGVFDAISSILQSVLCHRESDKLQLGFGDRNSRLINVTIARDNKVVRSMRDLLSLSAGESALFCLFASIVRDADLSEMQFQRTQEISGIVLVDEADLHLHLSLQLRALPKLIALFPKIQFVISVHAPLVALGMERTLGANGFEIRELPSGEQVSPESYSEFQTAFDVFAATRMFQNEVLKQINASKLPVLLVEGKTDAELVATAWSKLHSGVPMPFEPIAVGVEPDPEKRNGGADSLRRCTEYLSNVIDRTVVALFDNDSLGSNSFNSLGTKAGFSDGMDSEHKRHATKPMHAVLLPSPKGREDFAASNKFVHRFLSIEHYFSDVLLESSGLKSSPVLPGTSVFEIDATSKKKVAFANAANQFDPTEFAHFQLIFDRFAAVTTVNAPKSALT